MSSSLPHNNQPPSAVRLNGWEEISADLQKSVRTVQRWEKDLLKQEIATATCMPCWRWRVPSSTRSA